MTVNDGGVIFADNNLVARAEHLDGSLLQFQTCILADYQTTCQGSDILQHSLATVTKARSLDSTDLQLCTQTVYNQCGQCLAIYILGNNQQRTTALNGGFQDRKEVLQVADLLVIYKNVRILHYTLHLLGICYEVGRQITTVELHTFYNTDGSVTALSFFDGDNTVLANLLHGVSQKLTNLGVVVGTNGSNLLNLLIVVTYLLCLLLNVGNNGSGSLVDTTLQVHGVGACSNVFQTFTYDSLSQYGSGCCSVTGIVTSLAGNTLYQLSTCILEGVCQLDFLSNCYTILGNLRCTKLLLDNHITTLGAQCNLNGICQTVNALLHLLASVNIVFNIFSHNLFKFRMKSEE